MSSGRPKKITLQPIGVVHSPYKSRNETPRQGILKPEIEATIELYPPYEKGLKDIEKLSHLIVLYYFHKSKKHSLLATPPGERTARGVFATRSPHRPNSIGLALVRLLERKGNTLRIAEMDMIDGTPILDIKPYAPSLDSR